MSTPYEFVFPIVITESGLQPQTPASLQQQIAAAVMASQPGATTNLPGSLVGDILGTEVASVSIIDQAKVDTVNSLTPLGANIPLLLQLGALYGVPLGLATNTSVSVVFSGTGSTGAGYVVPQGLLISDGTYTYALASGTVIQTGGSSASILAVAIISGSWTPGAGAVTSIVSSFPTGGTLTVTNALSGTPGQSVQSWSSYRAQVQQAGLAACVGTGRFIKTLLGQIPGVTSNLVSVQQNGSGGIRVIAAGADSYAIAYAILSGVADPTELVGSAINSGRNVTVSLFDSPNTYSVKYVATQTQTITMTVTWNTTATSFSGGGAFPTLVQQPLVNYILSLAPGQVINVFEMDAIFQQAVSDSLDPSLLTRLVFAVSINGTPTNPATGTGAISGDAESSFACVTSGITVTQG